MISPPKLPLAVGIGLKPQHYADVLGVVSGSNRSPQAPAWLEVHPQNYFGDGGPPHRWLTAIATHFPLSFHSVGLSLGSSCGCDQDELFALKRLCARYGPAVVSDHLSWSGSPDDKLPDLLPLPYTHETLDRFAAEVDRVQNSLGHTILVENPSRYLAFANDDMDEVSFMHALCGRTGCGILLDINNVEVSATNLGLDPVAYVDAIDPNLIGEIHLAGHAREEHEGVPLLIDDHGSPVTDLTWILFERFIARAGARPVLIEWDTDVPDFETLMAEVAKAQWRMDRLCMAEDVARDHVHA